MTDTRAALDTTRESEGQGRSYRPGPASTGHIGRIVAGSLATGLVAAVILVAAPVIPPTEAGVTGAVLLGWALGWAMLAVLSARFTDQPQVWAVAPALFFGLSGLGLVAFGSALHAVLAWVWPPALLVLVMWVLVRARERLHSPSRRWLLHPVLATLALASLSGGYATVHGALDASRPVPGRLVDVGGHRLFLSCTGSGAPTVVIEPGAGGTSSTLRLVTPAVARDTRVCVYDRAGRGWSDPADTPRDATRVATDLHALLHRGQVPGPYVLAGHSFGGLYALTFAARHPDEVIGMVLVDSTAPAPATEPAAGPGTTPRAGEDAYDLTGRVAALVSTSARFGLSRLAGLRTAEDVRSTVDEYAQGKASAEQAASLRDLGDKPLVVLTAGIGHDGAWPAAQEGLADLSTDSVHRIVEGADHPGMVADEQGAHATAQAIHDVVASVRAGRPLDRMTGQGLERSPDGARAHR